MGANGQHASGVLEIEGNRRWYTVASVSKDVKILELKPVSGSKQPGVKLPEESHTENRVYAIMYSKDSKYQGIKAIAKYDENGKKIFEMHTSDHKGMGHHYHIWVNGSPGTAIQGWSQEMKKIYKQVYNYEKNI